jgi:hypothetical protein
MISGTYRPGGCCMLSSDPASTARTPEAQQAPRSRQRRAERHRPPHAGTAPDGRRSRRVGRRPGDRDALAPAAPKRTADCRTPSVPLALSRLGYGPCWAWDHEKRDRTVTSIYLSSDNPRWIPKTEADLQAAVDGGLFEESHHLDLKKAPNSKGDNKELARDLASFAVDGGTLIIGVQENKKSRTFELAPSR